MVPYKPKPRQPAMTKAQLRAQGVLAMAQATTPIIKLPMKVRRQCGGCGEFDTVMVESGLLVPAFKCRACGYPPDRADHPPCGCNTASARRAAMQQYGWRTV